MKNFSKWLIGFSVLFLFGCTQEKPSENTLAKVKTSDLSEVNMSLVESLGVEKVAVYDIELYKPDEVKYIEFWVEHYKNGEKQQGNLTGAAMGLGPEVEEKETTFTVAFAKTSFDVDEDKYDRWNSSLSQGGTTASSQSGAIKVEDTNLSEAFSSFGHDINIEGIKKPVTLAVTIRNDGNSMTMRTINFEDEEELEKFVMKYKEVFLYRIMLLDQEPFQ
ncbi:hypothetical protein IMZ08_07745 [Bacillus luteolus]|uniref:Lipoprotein n=2 Tax=Litchfieldia luteola TaxID=682179 RepID=A0ABR9QHH5_9BACI|nr:hypothetical protein [Cytobacillus luteolus]MBE4907943.1 hypothetical protein [Cytobacillus luteolus]MBP1942722.1 hypothetical protein [Cytobacillus luteolus]